MNWLHKELRNTISQKFMDMGNLALATLTFAAILANEPTHWWIPAGGIALWFFFYSIGSILHKGGGIDD
ncbi:MAG: hypothetical protein QME49_09420 [bacterium]|nr:hypothetical protein [bacterium]